MNVQPILDAIRARQTDGRVFVLAIDGRAGSGKTTLAAALSDALGAPVIAMDDFFLPPELRTAERRAEPGGNVHYERFAAEVLPHLASPAPFSYRALDCATFGYTERAVSEGMIRIVEGSYSRHPFFGDYADFTLFCDVAPDEQRRRIERRNGDRAQAFFDLWIPLEERYFAAFEIEQNADMIVK